MKRYVLWAILAVFLVAGPAGCGKKEIEALNTKVAELQKEVSDGKDQLAEKTKETDTLRAKADQLQATVDAQAAEIVKIKAERDKLNSELAAFRKKKK